MPIKKLLDKLISLGYRFPKRKFGNIVQWFAKKKYPFAEIVLLRLWPELLFSYSRALFNNSHLSHVLHLLENRKLKTENEKHLLERVQSHKAIIDGKQPWALADICSIKPFNHRVVMALHSSAPYDIAGYWHRTKNIFKCLEQRNIMVYGTTRPGYPWDLNKHRNLPRVITEEVEGVSFVRLSSTMGAYKQGCDFRFTHNYARQLAELTKNKDASVIHGHSNYLNGLAAVEAARLTGSLSVYEARGFWHLTRLSREPDYANTELFQYEEAMEKLALMHADRVVTLSSAMKRLIVSWGVDENKIHVVPNAVDIGRFSPLPSNTQLRNRWGDADFVVGFIGSITIYEGLLELVKAVQLLRRKGLKVSLVIAGTGPFEDDVKQIASGLDYIHFPGRIAHEDVTHWYASFDCCVYPRKDDVVCRYVPPMKVLEAMAMEIPVIVSDLPPLVEMVIDGETGLVCKPNDYQSVAHCLMRLLSEEFLGNKLAAAGRKWIIANRTWEVNAIRYLAVYS